MSLSGFSDTNYVTLTAASLDNRTVCTLAAWVYCTGASARMTIMGKGPSGALWDLGFATLFGSGGLSVTRATTGASAFASHTNWASWGLNKWMFIAAQWDTVTDPLPRVYIGDLTTLATEPSSYDVAHGAGSGAQANDSSVDLRIGRHSNSTNRQWVGNIGTTYIFDQFLTEAQIHALQFGGRGVQPVAHLECGWSGDGAPVDYSGSGNNGVENGTLTVDATHNPRNPPFGFDIGYLAFKAASNQSFMTLLGVG